MKTAAVDPHMYAFLLKSLDVQTEIFGLFVVGDHPHADAAAMASQNRVGDSIVRDGEHAHLEGIRSTAQS